jgi:hypothetical protein
MAKPLGYAFTVSYHYDVVRAITEFVDNDGNVLRAVIEARFVGTATNDTTGKVLPADGERHIVWDFAAGPDVIPCVELFEAGPHDVFEGQYADFCAALADS